MRTLGNDTEIRSRAEAAYTEWVRSQDPLADPYPGEIYTAGWIAGHRAKMIEEFTSGAVSLEDPPGRDYEPIGRADLAALSNLAAEQEAALFRRHPNTAGRHAGHLLCRALMQGAAMHYLNDANGIKDWDVWSFYEPNGGRPFPARWHGRAWYRGRRVDLFGRTLDAERGDDVAGPVRYWLADHRTKSAAALAWKPAVLIYPPDRAGEVIWRGGLTDAQ